MQHDDINDAPSHNDETGSSVGEYLQRASSANAEGNPVLAMHLYLAAFERGRHIEGQLPSEAAIGALKRAWRLACSLKERSIAEYVFERMEPYLSADELGTCAAQLQDLALDKLEEYGLSREELEDMTDMISQDLMGAAGASLLRVEHLTAPAALPGASARAGKAGERGGAAAASSTNGDHAEAAAEDSEARQPSAQNAAATPAEDAGEAAADAADGSPRVVSSLDHLTFKELVGYTNAIEVARSFGIGMQEDARFQELVDQLNARHGLDRMPATDALLIRSPAREDANQFMMAAIGELGLPVIRMRMEENMQGLPVLCVMAQADNQPKLNAARNAFEGPGVLVIEDIDMWSAPDLDPAAPEDFGGFIMASLSRGAREAVNLIRSAADSPDVYVLATAAEGCEVDPFFFDLMGPTSAIDIDYPTEEERKSIWMDIAREHPSCRGVDRQALVRYSAGMPRFDMYMAAREAIEEAYKESLMQRRYVPVGPENLFDKLAAYQPLDSPEYQALEQAVVDEFRRELDHAEDLLKGEGE